MPECQQEPLNVNKAENNRINSYVTISPGDAKVLTSK